jgi:hypothetical protein
MQTATAQLTKARKALMYQWSVTTDHWNDPVSNRIEQQHLEPLLDAVKAAIGAMETMGESVVRSRNECS